jgi:hypothetical protein
LLVRFSESVGRQQQLTGTHTDTLKRTGGGEKGGTRGKKRRGVVCRTIKIDKIKNYMTKKKCYICKKNIPDYYGNFCIQCWLELKRKAKVADEKKVAVKRTT